MYARVANGVIIEVRKRLNWKDSDGNRITDNAVFREQGWLPVDSSPPGHDGTTQRVTPDSTDQWIVGTETVTATYTIEDLPLDQAKKNYLGALREEREQCLSGGFTHDGDTWVASTDAILRLLQLSSRINAGRGLPRGKAKQSLRTSDDQVRQLNATEIEDLAIAGSDFIDAVDENAAVLEGQIMAATTLTELRNIDLKAGWPS